MDLLSKNSGQDVKEDLKEESQNELEPFTLEDIKKIIEIGENQKNLPKPAS
jgi:hypothetical protein